MSRDTGKCRFCNAVRQWHEATNGAEGTHHVYDVQLIVSMMLYGTVESRVWAHETCGGIRYCPECGTDIRRRFRQWKAEDKNTPLSLQFVPVKPEEG